ncbi:hypothetical protein A2368_00440 [Candidatus Collierbacteria bacterium RIFOXYB1_FULL_49_13]|uniref:Glycosyltransferase RgtA/B/C/D-like domain-containing protein n=1 Tax=Candidatus Collierbacteria bacterium RIFOXYB1_FULL_49_13 TaxID=1817728 RepID=A0A1F5FH59_9BACT|nr:MAG: hypothetical protein A2368_00440 [Candidatus Collierbacteria bacterium RIFOXYB1_FULL_49_13]
MQALPKLSWLFFPLILFVALILWPTMQGRLPQPYDIVTGTYYPWLNYRYLGLTTSTPVKNPLLSDPVSLAIPWRNHFSTSLRSLKSPWWNKDSLSGVPFLSSFFAIAPYNPLTLLTAFLPTHLGLSVFLYGQLILVSIAGYLLLRSYRVSRKLSLVGALALSLAGLSTTWFEYGSGNYSFAAILLLLSALENFFTASTPRFLPIPLSLLFLVVTGNPQLLIFGLLMSLIYLLTRLPWSKFRPKLGSLLLRFALPLGLAALLLLPVFRVYQESIRPGDLYIGEYAHGTFPLAHLLTLISPDYFGHPATYNYHGFYNYLEIAGYAGLLPLALFLFGHFLKPKSRLHRFYLGLTWITLIFLTQNPVSRFFYQLPIPVIGTSAASRLLYLFDLGLIISAVFTLQAIASHPRKLLRVGLLALALSLIALTARARATLPTVGLGIVLAGVGVLGFRFHRFPVVWCFALLLTLDLGRYFLKFNPYVSASLIYPVTPEIEYLQKNIIATDPARFQVYGSAMFPPNFNEVYNLESASGYHSAYPRWYGEFVGIINDGSITPHPGRYIEIKNPASPLFDFLNIRYLLLNTDSCTPTKIERPEVCTVMQNPKFQRVFTQNNLAIYQNLRTLPRFQLISNYAVKTPLDMADSLSDPSFAPDRLVYLEVAPSFASQENPQSKLEVLEYRDSSIKLALDTPVPTLLVVSNTYDSGWQAKLDKQIIRVLRANYAFQAYPIPKGSYNLELSYSPIR